MALGLPDKSGVPVVVSRYRESLSCQVALALTDDRLDLRLQLTRAAPSTGGRAESKFLSLTGQPSLPRAALTQPRTCKSSPANRRNPWSNVTNCACPSSAKAAKKASVHRACEGKAAWAKLRNQQFSFWLVWEVWGPPFRVSEAAWDHPPFVPFVPFVP